MEINDLLEQAKQHIAASRYMEPKGHNAVVAYRKILEQDSDNTLALRGLATIKQEFAQQVVKWNYRVIWSVYENAAEEKYEDEGIRCIACVLADLWCCSGTC